MAYLSGFGQLDPLTGMPKKKAGPGYTQAQVDASLAANPNAAGNPNGMYPMFGGGPTDYLATQPGGGGGSSAPQYNIQALLDSLLNPIKSDMAAQGQVDLAGRNAGINRAFVQYGQLPDFNAAQQALGLNLGEVVSPDTAQLAAANPYSATKQLAQQHTDAVRQIKHALAARGALQSGETGFALNKENQAYGQAGYDANQKLLDFISGLQQGYLQAQQARNSTLANSGSSAIQQLLAMFPNGLPGGPQQATPTPTPTPTPTQVAAPAPAPSEIPQQQTIAQAIQNYGPTAQQRTKFIGY